MLPFPSDVAIARARAKDLLVERSVRVGGPFTLASGKTSDFYVDVKQTSLYPEGAAALGFLLGDAVADLVFTAVGGPTLGADPLATATSLALYAKGLHAPAYIVRKEAKGHGTGQWMEGSENIPAGSAVILLEDVVTTGGSSLKAAQKVQAAGFKIAALVSVVDREEGGAQIIQDAGFEFRFLFTRSELVAAAESSGL